MIQTLDRIKELTEKLSVDTHKAFNGNVSAGIRARKTSQEVKSLLQTLRVEILNHNKK
jgi:hypothetical protein